MTSATTTLFTFGYWGWGNATPQLVQAVDAIEESRGWRPPRFVDIRLSRSVRAIGFRNTAFADLLSADRYTWMRDLGNKHIAEGGGGIEIARPEAAFDLLDQAIAEAQDSRRLIFFCACEYATNCHRKTVAELVLTEAARRRLDAEVVEWPGGDPVELERDLRTQAARSRKSLPLDKAMPETALLGLPWGSTLNVAYRDCRQRIVSGPARHQGGEWQMPILAHYDAELHPSIALEAGVALRTERCFDSHRSMLASTPPGRAVPWSSTCIYTIAHRAKLDGFLHNGGVGSLWEGKRWVTGEQVFREAQSQGREVPILFSDANDCVHLEWWGVLREIRVEQNGTSYRFDGLRRLGGCCTQDLYLESTGRRIAEGMIRPYAICKTGFHRRVKTHSKPYLQPTLSLLSLRWERPRDGGVQRRSLAPRLTDGR